MHGLLQLRTLSFFEAWQSSLATQGIYPRKIGLPRTILCLKRNGVRPLTLTATSPLTSKRNSVAEMWRPSTHSHRDIATDVKKKFRRGNVALVSTSCMDAWRDVIKSSSRAVVRYHWITL